MTARPPIVEQHSSAIEYRQPGRARLVPLLLISIALHLLVAWIVVLVLSRHLKEPQDVVDLGIDVTLGDAVQELIVAQPSTEPPAPEAAPPPPPPEPPPPEPPPEPPPTPTEKADIVEPVPELKPQPKPAPKRDLPKVPAKPAGAPPGAKVGPVPQAGVVGGVSKADKTTGTPGGQTVGAWRTPKPPYPAAALVSHMQATGSARITTDASGNVTGCEIAGLSAPFDSNTRSFARANWKGPPNSTRTVPVIYRIP